MTCKIYTALHSSSYELPLVEMHLEDAHFCPQTVAIFLAQPWPKRGTVKNTVGKSCQHRRGGWKLQRPAEKPGFASIPKELRLPTTCIMHKTYLFTFYVYPFPSRMLCIDSIRKQNVPKLNNRFRGLIFFKLVSYIRCKAGFRLIYTI